MEARGREEFYTGSGESPGTWMGMGAGLSLLMASVPATSASRRSRARQRALEDVWVFSSFRMRRAA